MRGEPMRDAERWMIEVRKLYERADDPIDTDEFSRLLDVAATGERPEHPELPMFLPFETESFDA